MVDEPALSRGYACLYARAGKVVVVRAVCIPIGMASQHDIYSEPLIIELSVSDLCLGSNVRAAVASTRLIKRFPPPFDPNYEKLLARLFGLKSTKALYSGMKNVLVRYLRGEVEFSPMRRLRGGYFEGFSDLWHEKKAPVIPFSASDEVWGAAAREAIEKAV